MTKAVRKKKTGKCSHPLDKCQKEEVVQIAKRACNMEVEKQHAMLAIAAAVQLATLTIGTNCIDLTSTSCTIAGSAYQAPRTGVRVTNHALNINVWLSFNTTPTTLFDCRIIVFLWKPTTATYNPTDALILGIPQSVVSGNSPFSFPAYNANSQYRILYDKQVQLTNNSEKQVQLHKIRLHGKKLPKHSAFDNPTTNNGAQHIFLWVVSNNNTGANQNTWLYNSEYVYSDA